VFIHDAVPDPEQAWRSWELDDKWPVYLSETFPSARILIYQYERTWVRSLSDIVNPERPRKIARELLEYLENEDNNSSVPIVVFAHGFGGILYEQVCGSSSPTMGNPHLMYCRLSCGLKDQTRAMPSGDEDMLLFCLARRISGLGSLNGSL
jgi:hypothetical protein